MIPFSFLKRAGAFLKGELQDSFYYHLHNPERPERGFWAILGFAFYIMLNAMLALPLLSLTGILIIGSLISLSTLILSSIFGYLGFVATTFFLCSQILIATFFWDKANEYYSFSWRHEVYLRQLSDELHFILICFIIFVVIASFIVALLSEKARKRQQRLEWLSIVDGLTEVYNHRYLHQRLEEEIARSQREQFPLGLLMIDLDNFKTFNDTYGHKMGDKLLKECAAFLRESVRINDVVCRYGGDEFAIILPNCSEEEIATLARRLIVNFSLKAGWLGEKAHPAEDVTISMGYSLYPTFSQDKDELIAHADSALYKAKQRGRNRAEAYMDFTKKNELINSKSNFCVGDKNEI